MSYCKEEGKDQIIFATKEDLNEPSTAIISSNEEDDDPPGLILANGDINWDCPCLGGMASGPCGTQFREAFSCFHYSKAEPKGSDCYDAFLTMQQCMGQYPELYPPSKAPEEEVEDVAGTVAEVGGGDPMALGSGSSSTSSNVDQALTDKTAAVTS